MTDVLLRLDAPYLQAGTTPDLPDKQAPALVDSRNVIFEGRSLSPFPGQSLMFAKVTSEPILGVSSTLRSGVPTLFFGTRTKLWDYTVAAGATDRSGPSAPYTGNEKNLWSMESWGSWMLATNGVDPIQISKTGAFADLGGSPPATARILRRYRAFMLAFNTANDPFEVAWCDYDDVETWTPTTTNLAGSLPARDLESPITAAVPFANMVAFFSNNEMRGVVFLGAPDVFGILPLVRGIGAAGIHAVCSGPGNRLFGWGPLGIWQTDGVSYDYMDYPLVRDFVYADLNRDRLSQVVALHLPSHRSVLFMYPRAAATYPDMGVGFNYDTKAPFLVDFGRTSALEHSEFELPVLGTSGGELLVLNEFESSSSSRSAPVVLRESSHGVFNTLVSRFADVPFGGSDVGERAF